MDSYTSQYLKGIFLLLCLSSGIFASAIVTPVVLSMGDFYLVSVNKINLIISIYLAGYLLGQIISASMGKMYSAIQVLRCGCIIFVVGSLICIYSIQVAGFYTILIGRFISAIGLSSGLVCSIYLINASFKCEHSIIWLSLGVVSYAIAIIVSVAIGGYFAEAFSWQVIFYLLPIYGLALLFGSFFIDFSEQSSPLPSAKSTHINKNKILNLNLFTYSLSMGFFTAIGYCYFEVGPSYAMNSLGLSPISYSYWNLFGVSGMLASPLIGRLCLMRKKDNTLFVCCIMIILTILVFNVTKLYYGANPVSFFSLIFILFLLGGVMYPVAASELNSSGNAGLYRTGISTFINLGSALFCLAILNVANFLLIDLFSIVMLLFSVTCINCIFLLIRKRGLVQRGVVEKRNKRLQ